MSLYKQAWISARDLASRWSYDKKTIYKIVTIKKFKTFKPFGGSSAIRIWLDDVKKFEMGCGI